MLVTTAFSAPTLRCAFCLVVDGATLFTFNACNVRVIVSRIIHIADTCARVYVRTAAHKLAPEMSDRPLHVLPTSVNDAVSSPSSTSATLFSPAVTGDDGGCSSFAGGGSQPGGSV
jgi:hypothetical protein